ncbi:MAG: hypothetical protein K2X77_12460 [Candidatus Obscuribacterales bacterium]|nr:hypothetical protein [Candidatus Obscuribacterales bacterium]
MSDKLEYAKLLDTPKQENVFEDFGRALAHSAQSPLVGVAQLIDKKADGPASKAVTFVDAPEKADFGSARWFAQQAGNTVGSISAILPLLAINKGVSGAMGRNYSMRAGLAMSESMSVLSTEQALKVSGLKMGEGAITGAIFSGVFSPVDSKTKNEDFWAARAHNVGVGSFTFGAFNGLGLASKSIADRTATSMPLLSRTLSSEVGVGVSSGIVAGGLSTQFDSLLSGKGPASLGQTLEGSASFALMGGGFAWAKGKLTEGKAVQRISEPSENFKNAGLDADGRVLTDSKRAQVGANLPDYSVADMNRARTQTLKDLSEIKALEPGKSVLDQFRDSNLSISQKYRVLSSLAEVREHFVKQQVNGKLDADQKGNWIHTQGEFGRVIDAAQASRLSPLHTEDALLSSMFADAVKSKANFFTHHMEGALAADHSLQKQMGAGFNRERLDGIVHSVREHQIGPPEFMATLYETRIKGALNFKLTEQQTKDLATLKQKMADPLNPNVEKVKMADGATVLKLTAEERSLLRLSGAQEWYVPENTNSWNKSSRAVIDGDSMDNYYTPGGIGKITSLGGPETDVFFITDRLDNNTRAAGRETNVGSARKSGLDAYKVISEASKPLADRGLALTEQAIENAKADLARNLAKQGKDPSKGEVPFFNSNLKYPEFNEHANQWWSIHRTPADKRTPEQVKFYEAHRYDGLSAKQIEDFKLAAQMREQVVDSLRAAQRMDGKQPPEYKPATKDTK